MYHELKTTKINKEIIRQGLIIQIKEMLGTLVDEIVDIDSYLENKSEKELKAIIKRIKIQNKLWVESKRGNKNGRKW